MGSFLKRFAAVVAIISLSACASAPKPKENYLDAGARQHIKTVDAVLIAKQKHIGADVKRNKTLAEISAVASGVSVLPVFLEAGVLAVNTMKAEKRVKPIRENLKEQGHDLPSEFRSQVRQSLEGTTLDGVDDIQIVRHEYPGLRGQLIAESEADAILLVDLKYSFTENFETLYLHSLAMLFPNHPELKQFQETPDRDNLIEFSDNIYRNQFAIGVSTKLEDATRAENAAVWADLPPEKLVEILDVAALTMADTISRDIGIDDLQSDLNLIPEGYALNTKFKNFNESYANIRTIDSIAETPPQESDVKPDSESEKDIQSVEEIDVGSDTES